MERIEKTIGNVVMENGKVVYYEGGSTFNGICFKDKEAFESGEGVCYISEYELQDLEEELADLEATYENSKMTDEDYRKDREEILNSVGWKREDIINECGGDGFEKLAEVVLDAVDWQSPTTYIQEIEYDDFCWATLGISEEMLKKAGWFD